MPCFSQADTEGEGKKSVQEAPLERSVARGYLPLRGAGGRSLPVPRTRELILRAIFFFFPPACSSVSGKGKAGDVFFFCFCKSVAPQVCDLLPNSSSVASFFHPFSAYSPPEDAIYAFRQPEQERKKKKKKKKAPKRITQSMFYERANVTTGFKGARNPARVIKLYERDGRHSWKVKEK